MPNESGITVGINLLDAGPRTGLTSILSLLFRGIEMSPQFPVAIENEPVITEKFEKNTMAEPFRLRFRGV
jgi:hypothetical protein